MLRTLKVLAICAIAVGLLAGFYFIPTDQVISDTGNSPLYAASLNSTTDHLTGQKDPGREGDSKGGGEGNLVTCETTCGPTCNQTTCGVTCVATCEYTCANTCGQETCGITCMATCEATCANTCEQETCQSTCVTTCAYTCEVPIGLVSFGAEADVNQVVLGWATASEIDNYFFRVWRSMSPDGNYAMIAEIPSAMEGVATTQYSITDNNVTPGVTYYYMLSDVSTYGYETMHPTVASATPLAEMGTAEEFVMAQNYPNPFNPSTTIRFTLPASALTRLDVYDMNGRVVNTLVNGLMNSGTHEIVWNATDQAGNILPSGMYLYRLTSGGLATSGKMLFVK